MNIEYYECLGSDPSKRTMRLCHLLPSSKEDDSIECTIDVVEMELVADKYTALSYTWASQDPRWIRLDNQPFIVQRNLFDGLKALRKGIRECVYLDRCYLYRSDQYIRAQPSGQHDGPDISER